MPIPSLSGSYIDQTYQRLVQTQGGEFADGLGNPITFGTIDTSSFATTGSNIFRGNQVISSSLTVVTGSGIELQVTNTGVRIGNALSDVHIVTGSLRVNGGITGSLLGTASFATTASFVNTASLALSIQGGSTNYVPLWNSATTLGISNIYQNNGNVGVGTTEAAHLLDVNGDTRIIGEIIHNTNIYGTINLKNPPLPDDTLVAIISTTKNYPSIFINYYAWILDESKIIASRSGQVKASYLVDDNSISFTDNATQHYTSINYNITTENLEIYFQYNPEDDKLDCILHNRTGYNANIKGEYLLVTIG